MRRPWVAAQSMTKAAGKGMKLTEEKHWLEHIARWLANDAPHDSVKGLFDAFCHKIVEAGVPLGRASLGLEVLHPETSGWQHIWTSENVSVEKVLRASSTTSVSYLTSPTRIVDETNQPFRQRLDSPCTVIPLLEELRLAGATDYIMYPLPFLNQTRTAVMSFATQRKGGFDESSLEALEMSVKLLSPYMERYVLRRIAIDLLDTYVGAHTGTRILDGQVERGAADMIEAAIWFADLRGFTRMSEHLPVPEMLTHLNAWFTTVGEVVEAHGGEVLKFIGDAVLAIFPTSADRDRAAACRSALAAAQEFCRRSEAENKDRRSADSLPLHHCLGLHVGEVAYGNVGAPHRLDFTVIGPAVNVASRLVELCKRLDREVLISDALAQEVNQPLIDLGDYDLRGIDKAHRVYSLPDQTISSETLV